VTVKYFIYLFYLFIFYFFFFFCFFFFLYIQNSTSRSESKTRDIDSDCSKDNEANGDEIEYRIQFILGKKSMPQSEWRDMNQHYTTMEVTKGSVWQQPDEEYYDNSPESLEKFLIKWMHASFLHVSWETEKDLLDNVGPTAKQHIKKFRMRELEGRELFEDLSKGEFVPPSFYQIERILDVDDPEVDMYKVDWQTAMLPEANDKKNIAALARVNVISNQEVQDGTTLVPEEREEKQEEEEEEDVQPVRRSTRRTSKRSMVLEDDEDEDEVSKIPTKTFGKSGRCKKQKLCQYLHGNNCWVTVKWEGLPYSDVSFECINDLIIRGVEFESQLRAFYRREQRCLSEPPMQKKGPRKLILDQTIIGSNSTPPTFPGGTLRDYQWEGVRWMLFNLVQGRNCILADEMGLGKVSFLPIHLFQYIVIQRFLN
jgi:SNF2 family DNA or RNA helicase